MNGFLLGSLAATAAVGASAWRSRGKPYGVFSSVILGLHSLATGALAPHAGPLLVPMLYLQGTVFTHFLMLVRPSMKPFWYRALVSVPGSWFAAGSFLALPWAMAAGVGLTPHGAWLPYLVSLVGVVQSLRAREQDLDLVVDGEHVPVLKRHRSGSYRAERPLHVVQLTDTHLGPFMSVDRLRKICERVVARQPDLVLLTGDFLTMESQGDPSLLLRALEPLKALQGKCFACMGNHDYEAPEVVYGALRAHGIRLLVDEIAEVQTPIGPIELLGVDFVWREREKHFAALAARFPRREGVQRLMLLHDPLAFRHMPEALAELVFSGHTHGGQLGLLILGLEHTVISAFSKHPDHGLWAQGRARLYVHRGTGHYGFPLRVGVPSEESLLRVHLQPRESGL